MSATQRAGKVVPAISIGLCYQGPLLLQAHATIDHHYLRPVNATTSYTSHSPSVISLTDSESKASALASVSIGTHSCPQPVHATTSHVSCPPLVISLTDSESEASAPLVSIGPYCYPQPVHAATSYMSHSPWVIYLTDLESEASAPASVSIGPHHCP